MIFSYHFLPISMLEEPIIYLFTYTKDNIVDVDKKYIDD